MSTEKDVQEYLATLNGHIESISESMKNAVKVIDEALKMAFAYNEKIRNIRGNTALESATLDPELPSLAEKQARQLETANKILAEESKKIELVNKELSLLQGKAIDPNMKKSLEDRLEKEIAPLNQKVMELNPERTLTLGRYETASVTQHENTQSTLDKIYKENYRLRMQVKKGSEQALNQIRAKTSTKANDEEPKSAPSTPRPGRSNSSS